MRQTIRQTYGLIRSDFIKRCEYEKKSQTLLQFIKFLFYPGFDAILVYRLQRFFHTHHLGIVAGILKLMNQLIFTVSIDSSAIIGPRIMLLHASYIVIGPGVRIGSDFLAAHNNSIMASPFFTAGQTTAAPVLGDHIMLGGGAQVTGPITLGNRTQVSMNTSVEESYGDGAILLGVPARNLNKNSEAA